MNLKAPNHKASLSLQTPYEQNTSVASVRSNHCDFKPNRPIASCSTHNTPSLIISQKTIDLNQHDIERVSSGDDAEDEQYDNVFTPPINDNDYHAFTSNYSRKSSKIKELFRKKTIDEIEHGSIGAIRSSIDEKLHNNQTNTNNETTITNTNPHIKVEMHTNTANDRNGKTKNADKEENNEQHQRNETKEKNGKEKQETKTNLNEDNTNRNMKSGRDQTNGNLNHKSTSKTNLNLNNRNNEDTTKNEKREDNQKNVKECLRIEILQPTVNKTNTTPESTGSDTTALLNLFHPRNRLNNNHLFYHPLPNSTFTPISNVASIDSLDSIPHNEAAHNELKNYDNARNIGNGTDATVYLVNDRRDDSQCAMKLTKRKSGRYKTEIHLLYNLRTCPYIVQLLKCIEHESVYILIMEYAPTSLEKLLSQRCCDAPMNENTARCIMLDLFRGIRAIHALGFVHKDIKPENILIFANVSTQRLDAKIADFGFATRAHPQFIVRNDGDTNNSSTNFSDIPKEKIDEFRIHVEDKCGTPGFWAPELVAGCVDIEEACKMDVFSAGVSIYRTLCNEMPFGLFDSWRITVSKTGESKLEKLKPNFQVISWHRHPKTQEYIPNVCNQQLSSICKDLIRGMLRIRPKQRFSIDHCLEHSFFKNLNNDGNTNDNDTQDNNPNFNDSVDD